MLSLVSVQDDVKPDATKAQIPTATPAGIYAVISVEPAGDAKVPRPATITSPTSSSG